MDNRPIHAIDEKWSEILSDDYYDRLFELRERMDRLNSIKYSRDEITQDYIDENLLYNAVTYTLTVFYGNNLSKQETLLPIIETLTKYSSDTILDELEKGGYAYRGYSEENADDILKKIPRKVLKKNLKKYKLKRKGKEKDWLRELSEVEEFREKYLNFYIPTSKGLDLIYTDLFGMLPVFSNKIFHAELLEYSKDNPNYNADEVVSNFLKDYVEIAKERQDHIGLMDASHMKYSFETQYNKKKSLKYLLYHIILGYNPVFLENKFLEAYPLVDMSVVNTFYKYKVTMSPNSIYNVFNNVWNEYDMDLILKKEEMKDILDVMLSGKYTKDFEMEMKFKYLINK